MPSFVDHAERAHALLGPSGASRWMRCTKSARLEEEFPDERSPYAAEGTLCHELCEVKARNYFLATVTRKQMLERVAELKKDPLWHDEMEECSDEWVRRIKERALAFKTAPVYLFEVKLDLESYIPGGFGTADAVLISDNTIAVFDYKHGKGVPVYAEHNPQMMIYALGALEAYRFLFPIDKVEMHIVQPRIDNYSSWSCSADELFRFGEEVKAKADLAYEGKGEFTPGDWCRFCRARATCRARAEENVRLAFASKTKPELLSNEEIGKYLKTGTDVAKWLEDLKEYALKECLNGHTVEGYKAVAGRGSRAFEDTDKAFEKLEKEGIDEAMLYERKPLTVAKIEKLIGKKQFATMVGDMVVKTEGKPTLVPESDKREAVTNVLSAEEAFK